MKLINKKLLLAVPMVAFGLASFGAGEGASQKWVKQYVEQYVSNAIARSVTTLTSEAKTVSSNGVNTIAIGEGEGRVTLTWEDATVYALMVTNAVSDVAEYGITNGFVFVWDGDNSFVNGNGEIVKIASDTNKTCYTWHEIDSVRTNNLDVFDGKFAVGGVMIQPSVALGITNALAVASARSGVLNTLFSLLLPSAYAAADRGSPDYWTKGTSSFEDQCGKITIPYKDENGNKAEKSYSVSLDTLDLFDYSFLSVENRNALDAMKAALQAKKTAQNIAEQLAAQDWDEKNAEVKDTSSGVSSYGNITKTGTGFVVSVPNSLTPKVDGLTIENATLQTPLGKKYTALSLAGIPNAIASRAFPSLTSASGDLDWYEATNMADNSSIVWGGSDFQIKGWKSQGACNANMRSMLADPGDLNASKHHVLCRYKNGEAWVAHYVPFGTGGIADEHTLTAKAEGKKTTSGQMSVKGAYTSTNAGKVLASTGNGITWNAVGVKVVGTDGTTNWKDDDDAFSEWPAQTITFASAKDSNVKVTVEGTKDSATITIGVYYK